jgi:hypothetical protein
MQTNKPERSPPEAIMNTPTSAEVYVLPRWLRGWERFWFTPGDPTVLGLIRIAGGLVIFYTLFVYSFTLQEAVGENAWQDLPMRMEIVRDRPVPVNALSGFETAPLPPPANEFQAAYVEGYEKRFGVIPPPPYPTSMVQAVYLEEFRIQYNMDLRAFGLTPPTTEAEYKYVDDYMRGWRHTPFPAQPPPAYAKDAAEQEAIDDYRQRYGIDPRRLYDRGQYVFSLWFHVTDKSTMELLHGLIVFTSFLFLIGFCTRLTSAITWFGSLCYIHRSPAMLFGVDTMMNILLLYLMIGPSGAVCSVDAWMRRWWNQGKPGTSARAAPSVTANVALRLLQVHVCVIYLFSGLSKLQGTAWWNGTAVWGVIANYEVAPMRYEVYLNFLRFVGGNQLYFSFLVTAGGFFTLIFEISYPFLIWRPSLRWIFLASAILLHGFIGLFMGLTTFTLLMVVMNMAFLRKEEAQWILGWFGYRSPE